MQPQLNGSDKAYWQNSRVDDIAYIKKHLRYKPTLKTFLPAIFWGGFLLLVLILLAASVYVKITGNEKIKDFNVLVTLSIVIPFTANIVRYLQSLKFISLPTGFHIAENSLLLEQFLKSKYLACSRHPDIPEIFQILSRNLSAGKEDREVLIFIADDQRILINSHFSNRWGFLPAQRHHRQMAKMLKDFLNNYSAGTGLMHQTF
jgi:hypothetical protein